eukprot:1182336-Prymnesium_polylepis.2
MLTALRLRSIVSPVTAVRGERGPSPSRLDRTTAVAITELRSCKFTPRRHRTTAVASVGCLRVMSVNGARRHDCSIENGMRARGREAERAPNVAVRCRGS